MNGIGQQMPFTVSILHRFGLYHWSYFPGITDKWHLASVPSMQVI